MFARAAGNGTHPRLAEILADLATDGHGTADDQFARVLGLMVDGLLAVSDE